MRANNESKRKKQEAGRSDETNCHGHVNDFKWVNLILAKRTDRSNSMNQWEMILKILKRFIRLVAGLATLETKPNEAIVVKPSVISYMRDKFRKRSHWAYVVSFQTITAEKVPFFGKNECSPSMIQAEARSQKSAQPPVEPD